MTPQDQAVQAVLEAVRQWREVVYQIRQPNVWPEEKKLAAAVDALSFARKESA